MFIYRIESPKTKDGPYDSSHSDACARLCSSHNKSKEHPVIYIDMSYSFEQGVHKCGFESEDHLKKWFKGHRKALRENGFKMAIYSINKKYVILSESGKQIAFEFKKAKLKEYMSIP